MGLWGWGLQDGTGALIRVEVPPFSLPILLSVSTMWGLTEKAVIYKPGRELPPEPDYAGTLIPDFQFPELWENKCLLFKLLNLWYFIIAAQAN